MQGIEIGSEFEQAREWNPSKRSSNFDTWELTYSGRTAIQLVLEDIGTFNKKSNVWMPSYCCASMMQPFVEKGLKVKFYPVSIFARGRRYCTCDELLWIFGIR